MPGEGLEPEQTVRQKNFKSQTPTIDANLGYEHLGEMREGDGAQAALRAAVLNYCRHDTWVVVMLRGFCAGRGLG